MGMVMVGTPAMEEAVVLADIPPKPAAMEALMVAAEVGPVPAEAVPAALAA